MNQPPPHHIPNPAVAPIRDGEHYRHLLGRTKWYLLISGLTVLVAAFLVVFLVVRPENPELTARALIGLENTTDISGAKEGVTANLGREDIMMSRTFLRDVARKLSLQLWTAPHGRDEMFDTVSIDSSAACGTYRVRFSPGKPDEFLIYYYDTTAISLPLIGFLPGNGFKIIALGNWQSGVPVRLPGMSLKLSRSLRERPHSFTFRVVDIRVAVEAVYRNLTIKRADPDKGINYIAILLTGRDYSLAASTANTIADAFIEKNVSFSQSRDRGVVASLEKQLKLSQENLAAAESKIRDFRSKYPQVGLNQQTQQTVSSLAQLDNGIQHMSANKTNGITLRNEYLTADSAQRLQIAGEIAEMLSSHSIPAGKVLSEGLNQLLAQRQEMIDKYGEEHPLRLENNRSIQRVSRSILAALDVYIGSAQTAISDKQKNVQQLSGRLRQLPAQEMQLGELRRNQQIFADIYSAVLSRYNQAKVADAVQTAAFYIMDYAVAPLPPPANPGRLLVYGILIALLVSFGPVFVYNYFDKSVRSQRQLARITSHVVLEAIPLFFQTGEKHRMHVPGYHPLISLSCNPNFTREIFDSLLVKIKLLQVESADHCIVVSSFEGGCGKSTISANLAIAIALRGHRTLLVDADLRRGTVKDIFNLPDSGGITALLSGQKPLSEDDCIRSMVPVKIPNLYVIPSGKEPANPGLLLSSPRMEEFKRHSGKHLEYMIIDTPPLGIVSDAVVIQKFFSHYILVVRSGKTNVAELVTRINEFDQLSEKILGYVLNGASHNAVGTYRRYSKYYTK
ncbi:MAG: polysaccharide biosynthesis tyrosine autokinase [Chitinispirillaceae bacterium]|nr:polysaccharide biosynthesis tyrosine autokinase [Chitinispirillaceae bacterium]